MRQFVRGFVVIMLAASAVALVVSLRLDLLPLTRFVLDHTAIHFAVPALIAGLLAVMNRKPAVAPAAHDEARYIRRHEHPRPIFPNRFASRALPSREQRAVKGRAPYRDGFGERVLHSLARRDVSRAELARRLMVTRGTVTRWVQGQTTPSKERLGRLAGELMVPIEYLTARRA